MTFDSRDPQGKAAAGRPVCGERTIPAIESSFGDDWRGKVIPIITASSIMDLLSGPTTLVINFLP